MNADELAMWRQAHDLSLDELATLLDVNRMTIYKWEHGKHAIPHMLELALWALDHQPLPSGHVSPGHMLAPRGASRE